MKLICAIALLSCTLTLSAEWGIRLNVYGEGKVELAPAPGETYVHNIQWGEEKARKYSLYVQKKGFPDEGETTFSFSFLPKQSGRVILELSGCLIQRPKMKEPDKAFLSAGVVFSGSEEKIPRKEGFWQLQGFSEKR